MTPRLVALHKPPSDLSRRLRELADLADAGELTDAVMAYTWKDERHFMYATSLNDGLILATMLQSNCLDRLRV